MRRTGVMPQLEELGPRVLPSAITLAHPPELAAALVAQPLPPQLRHPLAGRGSGTYATDPVQSEAGTVYHIHGTAALAGLGQVDISGSVRSVGFLQQGRAGGTLTLTSGFGSVTVDLTGPEQPGFSHLPHYFHYRVVSGTGAYLHLADSGTLRLDFHAHPSGAQGERGSFSLWI